MKQYQPLLALIPIFLGIIVIIIVNKNDTKLNNTWDKCQERFEKSGAPMEARDGIMRACFSE